MSSYNAKNPTGGAIVRCVKGVPDPNLHLLERILTTENVRTAWERVRANKGAPGVDNVSIDQFPDRFRPQWNDIRKSILAGSYNPSPVKRVDIPKASGGTRPLGIPCVLDRLIQQAICQILMPIFDPGFSVGENSLSGHGPIKFMNRMSGGVGRRGESPLFTRFDGLHLSFFSVFHGLNNGISHPWKSLSFLVTRIKL